MENLLKCTYIKTLIGILVVHSCFASEAPAPSYWERFKAAIGLQKAKIETGIATAEKALTTKAETVLKEQIENLQKGIKAFGKGEAVSTIATLGAYMRGATNQRVLWPIGGFLAYEGAEQALQGIVTGNIASSMTGGALMSAGIGLGSYALGGAWPFLEIQNIMIGTTALTIASVAAQKLWEWYNAAKLTKQQLIDANKYVFSKVLETSDEFPTLQTKLDALDHAIGMYQKDQTEQNQLIATALQSLKNELTKTPLYKEREKITKMCSQKGGCSVDELKNSQNKYDKNSIQYAVYGEFIIDTYLQEYYYKLKFEVNPELIDQPGKELELLTNRLRYLENRDTNPYAEYLKREIEIDEELKNRYEELASIQSKVNPEEYKALKAVYKNLKTEQQVKYPLIEEK